MGRWLKTTLIYLTIVAVLLSPASLSKTTIYAEENRGITDLIIFQNVRARLQ